VVNEKLGDDLHLRSELQKAFQRIKQEDGAHRNFKISSLEVKIILNRILKREMLKFTNSLEEKPSSTDNVVLSRTSVNTYASDVISQILLEYRNNFQKEIAQDTFTEMQDLLSLFS